MVRKNALGFVPLPVLFIAIVLGIGALLASAAVFTIAVNPTKHDEQASERPLSFTPNPTATTSANLVSSTTPTSTNSTAKPAAKSGYRLDSVSPNPAHPGDVLTLKGAGFGTEAWRVNISMSPVSLGLEPKTAGEYWTDTEIKVKLPSAGEFPYAGYGRIGVEKKTDPKYTNDINFTLLSNDPNAQLSSAPPVWHLFRVDGVAPQAGRAGDTIVITGVGFGTTPGKVQFTKNDNTHYFAPIVNWSDTKVTVTVPSELIYQEATTVGVWDSEQRYDTEFFDVIK